MTGTKKKKSRSPSRRLSHSHPLPYALAPPSPLTTRAKAARNRVMGGASASPSTGLWGQGSSPLRRVKYRSGQDGRSVTPGAAEQASGGMDTFASQTQSETQESQAAEWGSPSYTQGAIQSALDHLDWSTQTGPDEPPASPTKKPSLPARFPNIPELSPTTPSSMTAVRESEVTSDTEDTEMATIPSNDLQTDSVKDTLSTRLIHNIEHLLAGLHSRRQADTITRKRLEQNVEELEAALATAKQELQQSSEVAAKEAHEVKTKHERQQRNFEREIENLKNIRVLERKEARAIQDDLREAAKAMEALLKRLVKLAAATEYYV